ncbi:MAG: MBL fold metallo-hydrolase [Anaerolineales bacterium]|nr:MBL fold metallo-hydrolase [Anaerolineales bacterium]
MTPKTFPQSEHITLHELADGVYAALAQEYGLGASNSGIVDLGDRTLVFDTTLSPASAADLRNAAEYLTGRPVDCVLNSHWHLDHVLGNTVFAPETEFYATTRTSEIMVEKIPENILELKKHWPEQQAEWAEKAKMAKDEAERVDYEDGVRFAQKIIDTFLQLELRLPDRTFTDRIEFKGTKRSVEFVTYGGGHTDSDAILHLPAERIVFSGDLLVIKFHPSLIDGRPREWLDILAKIKLLDPVQLVPGHGRLGTLVDVTSIERYINEILQMAEKNWGEGGTAESAAALQPPTFTEGWNNIEGFALNMKFLHEAVQH